MLGPDAISAGGMPRWGNHASVVRRRPPLYSAGPSTCRRCHCLLAPLLLGWRGGFHSLPVPVFPPLVIPCPRWSLQGFCPPVATQSLRGCWCPVETQLPHPLPGGTPWVFRHSGGLASPLLIPHSRGLVGRSGVLAAPVVIPHSLKIFRPISPACLRTSPFASDSPHGGPALPPCWRP